VWRASDPVEELHVAFIDVQKAYDTVDIALLMQELTRIGIPPSLLVPIALYLSRTPKLVLQGTNDLDTARRHPIEQQRGLPQGGVLSPLLYTVYMARLPALLREAVGDAHRGLAFLFSKGRRTPVRMLMYADDMILFARDRATLQQLVDVVSGHARTMGYDLNVSAGKTEYMLFSVRAQPPRSGIFVDGYATVGGGAERRELRVAEEYKYLGVTLTPQLDTSVWSSKVHAKYKNAHRVWMRLFEQGMVTAADCIRFWTGTVRPQLEYGLETFPRGLAYAGGPDKWAALNAVQCKATDRVLGITKACGAHRLKRGVRLGEVGLMPVQGRMVLLRLAWRVTLRRQRGRHFLAAAALDHDEEVFTRECADVRYTTGPPAVPSWTLETSLAAARWGVRGAQGHQLPLVCPSPLTAGVTPWHPDWYQSAPAFWQSLLAEASKRMAEDASGERLKAMAREAWCRAWRESGAGQCAWSPQPLTLRAVPCRLDWTSDAPEAAWPSAAFYLRGCPAQASKSISWARLQPADNARRAVGQWGPGRALRGLDGEASSCPVCQCQDNRLSHLLLECPALEANREAMLDLLSSAGGSSALSTIWRRLRQTSGLPWPAPRSPPSSRWGAPMLHVLLVSWEFLQAAEGRDLLWHTTSRQLGDHTRRSIRMHPTGARWLCTVASYLHGVFGVARRQLRREAEQAAVEDGVGVVV
jgi:hypothetical protein